MLYKLTIPIGFHYKTAFLHEGFYSLLPPSCNLHRHTLTEFHAIIHGNARFMIGSNIYDFSEGDIFSVPPGVFHTCLFFHTEIQHIVFQIDAPVKAISHHHMSKLFLQAFADLICRCSFTDDHTKIACCLSLMCCDFYPDIRTTVTESNDQAFMIYEFFSHRYRDNISLSDLASELHFSERHTGRLVQKYTGQSFTDTLISHRLSIARYLADTTNMSMNEIAEYVGYKSNSGFWKAYQKSIKTTQDSSPRDIP